MKGEVLLALVIILGLVSLSLWAGYNIRGAENGMVCIEDNTVVIYKKGT